jgi:hypothetical protein
MNKQEENNSSQKSETVAQYLFKDKQILTARPEGMDYQQYKALLTMQNRMIRKATASKPSYKIMRLMPLRYGYNEHSPFRLFKNTETNSSDNQGEGQ